MIKIRLALGVLAAVVATVARAQPPEAPEPVPEATIPLYKVEIVAFAYRDFNPSEERFDDHPSAISAREPVVRREAPRLEDLELESLDSDDPLDIPRDAPDTGLYPPPFRFRLLAPEELQLTGHYQTLQRISAYVALLHGGWVQQGLPEAEAEPFDLSLLGVSNPSGRIRLHLSRFLHLRIDLSYQPAGSAPVAPSTSFGSRELNELALAPRYTLSVERQTRSGDLHYFDHPAFGLLVLVTPLPADAPPLGARPAA
jgi:hypothetical protein